MTVSIKSKIPGMVWPAIPDAPGSRLLAVLFQMEKSQYQSADERMANQFQQINEVFRHSVKSVPYYKNKYKAAGLRRNSKINPATWSRLPILTRSKVQENFDELQSRKMPGNHGRTHLISTSGSTGLPIKVTGTELTSFFYMACAMREHLWHERDLTTKTATIRIADGTAEYPGIALPGWGAPVDDVVKTGSTALLTSTTDISLQVKFLLRENPSYLLSYPSNLEALAKYFIEEGLHLDNLKEARSLGEAVGSGVRPSCREAWGVGLVDMYTAMEVGYIALQCPENENVYHVQSENLFVEILNDKGQPCAEGEIGQVVVTTLNNFAMPLIRYQVGDYAEVGGTCSCGRTLPVLTRILGRKRNMLLHPDGKKIWPTLRSSIWAKDVPAVKQFQFVQKSIDTIKLRLVVKGSLNQTEVKGLKKILREQMRYPFNIEIEYLDEIPRSKSGKFEDFISEII